MEWVFMLMFVLTTCDENEVLPCLGPNEFPSMFLYATKELCMAEAKSRPIETKKGNTIFKTKWSCQKVSIYNKSEGK